MRTLLVFTLLFGAAPLKEQRVLRVCADPNNMPYSNMALEGFENKLAGIIADELHAHVEYTWWAQRRGFLRNTLNAGVCDVVMGVPHDLAMLSTTEPYYRSSYVFVTRKDRGLDITSLDDPLLQHLKIGVQLIGDDMSNAPPAHALAQRGVVNNVVGFMVYGDYARPNPASPLIDAVLSGEIDVAIAWGPLAGWIAKQQKHGELVVTPLKPARARRSVSVRVRHLRRRTPRREQPQSRDRSRAVRATRRHRRAVEFIRRPFP
jgi:mxaJ protein